MAKNQDNALPKGTALDEFVIDGVLGGGGFSIVYNAHHNETQLPVVIKEYMPQKLAKRGENFQVVSISEAEKNFYIKGQKLFFQEVKSLSLLKHSNIVNVITFFQANGTTYMVMDEVKGVNLQSYIKKHDGRLSEKLLRIIFKETLSALQLIHSHNMLHLDIKPGNIHLRPGGLPMLLDFGAVRNSQGSRLFDTRVVATSGFAPVEQITERGYLGPWTDIYALGATIRSCIDGKPLPPSDERAKKDILKSAVENYRTKYSEEFLSLLDWSTDIEPRARPQNCQELIDKIIALPEIKKIEVEQEAEKKGFLSGLSSMFAKKDK